MLSDGEKECTVQQQMDSTDTVHTSFLVLFSIVIENVV